MENPPVLYNESMDYLFPDYYRKFHCAGGGCPLTCCGGWQSCIDPASLDRYRKTKGPLGARLQNEIDWREGCFRQYGGKCALLSEEGLCDLYSEGGGRKAFCTACRDFPRHLEEFKGVREVSLSLSCQEAESIHYIAAEAAGVIMPAASAAFWGILSRGAVEIDKRLWYDTREVIP